MKKVWPWLTGSILIELRNPVLAWGLILLTLSLPMTAIVYIAVVTSSTAATRLRAENFQARIDGAAKLRTDIELASLRATEFLRGLPTDLDIDATLAELETAPPEYGAAFAARDGEVYVARAKDPRAPASDPALHGLLEDDFRGRRDLMLLVRTKMLDTSMPVQSADLGSMWLVTRPLRNRVRVGWLIDARTIAYTANRIVGENLGVEEMVMPPKESRATTTAGNAPDRYEIMRNMPNGVPNTIVTLHLTQKGMGKVGGATPDEATAVVVSDTLGVRVITRRPDLLESSIKHEQKRIRILILGPSLAFVLSILWLFARARGAQRLADLRTDFVAAVSHELRTPLASVRMFAELLEAGEVPEDERVEVEQALAGETRRLHATLDRMLRYGALARGKLVIEKKMQPLGPIAKEAATKRDVSLDIPEDLEANVDAGMLGLALDNLLSNAKKYAPDGGPYLVRARAEGKDVLLSVSDNGPGLSKKAQKKVFLPFERADERLSKATEGSGVGLALVRGIARAHGGDATISSEPGHGATFTLRLPRA